jgi:glycosyltransferase involved in cell wall biosynthesis
VFRVKKKYPNKIMIHRVDGPVSYVRGKGKVLDGIIFKFNDLVADGTIFQSNWSREKNYEIGMKKLKYETVTMNAPDPTIFNPKGKKPFNETKIKLIATSWSPNIRKGFDMYKFLDEHLDFSKYEMTFVGNSPIVFKNIKLTKPVPSQQVAKILKAHDIFVIASRNDPCSNSLIEALHCGLPVVARNDGGHPEIIGEAGEFFEDEGDVIGAIEKIIQDYRHYQTRTSLPTPDVIGQRYYEFAKNIYEDYLNGNYHPKVVNLFSTMKFMEVRMKIVGDKALNETQTIIKMVRNKGKNCLR